MISFEKKCLWGLKECVYSNNDEFLGQFKKNQLDTFLACLK